MNASTFAGVSKEGAPFGRIEWRFDVHRDLSSRKQITTPGLAVGGMTWGITAVNFESMNFYLTLRKNDYKVCSVDVATEFKLINYEDDAKSFIKKSNITFVEDEEHSHYISNSNLEEALEEQGFLKNNRLTVNVHFSLSNIIGFSGFRQVKFTDANEPSHDVAFMIQGWKLHANKGILAVHSPFFHRMFYDDSKEMNEKEIELKDITQREFFELLSVIYPPSKTITDRNVECLLKLSDRFEMSLITHRAEEFLITSHKSIAAKLLIAEEFRLLKLQFHCLNQMKTIKNVTDLQDSEDFKNFSESLKVALFDKIMELSKEK